MLLINELPDLLNLVEALRVPASFSFLKKGLLGFGRS